MVALTMKVSQVDIDTLLLKSRAWSLRKRTAVASLVERYTILIYQEAIRIIPVDTGNLKDSIYTILDKTAMGASGVIRTDSTTYAIFVEFGTKFMEARPYMRNAFKRYIESFIMELEAIFQML
ncbi:MAG: hypothetical protein GY938_12945 [Ketobacter sp.]|nr:hypothetical protein [Ketobacter sp.]